MSEKNDIKNENIRVVIDTGVWIIFFNPPKKITKKGRNYSANHPKTF